MGIGRLDALVDLISLRSIMKTKFDQIDINKDSKKRVIVTATCFSCSAMTQQLGRMVSRSNVAIGPWAPPLKRLAMGPFKRCDLTSIANGTGQWKIAMNSGTTHLRKSAMKNAKNLIDRMAKFSDRRIDINSAKTNYWEDGALWEFAYFLIENRGYPKITSLGRYIWRHIYNIPTINYISSPKYPSKATVEAPKLFRKLDHPRKLEIYPIL